MWAEEDNNNTNNQLATNPKAPLTFDKAPSKHGQKKKKYYFLTHFIGNLLIVGAIAAVLIMLWPYISSEVLYIYTRISRSQDYQNKVERFTQEGKTEDQDKESFGEILKTGPSLTIEPINKEFAIVIEKINVNASIAPNVSVSNAEEYLSVLKEVGAAHASGSVMPGKTGNSYIFAHATRYPWEIELWNAPFTLLNKLESGDRVVIFYLNKRYDYEVKEKFDINPNDVSPLQYQTDKKILTLQTCNWSGDFDRHIVRAELIGTYKA